MNILYLPLEIFNEILKYLTTKEICKLLLISKSFQKNFLSNKIKLDLNFSKTNIHYEYFKYFNCIHTINLNYCYRIIDKGLSFLKNVSSINLKKCDKITDKGLSFLKNVSIIDLISCIGITDKGLSFLKNVSIIDLTSCIGITDKGFSYSY